MSAQTNVTPSFENEILALRALENRITEYQRRGRATRSSSRRKGRKRSPFRKEKPHQKLVITKIPNFYAPVKEDDCEKNPPEDISDANMDTEVEEDEEINGVDFIDGFYFISEDIPETEMKQQTPLISYRIWKEAKEETQNTPATTKSSSKATRYNFFQHLLVHFDDAQLFQLFVFFCVIFRFLLFQKSYSKSNIVCETRY